VPRVASIKESPSLSGMCRVFKLVTQWWVNGNGGWGAGFRNSGVVPSTEGFRWVTLDAVVV